jgi:putative transcriptional regulator
LNSDGIKSRRKIQTVTRKRDAGESILADVQKAADCLKSGEPLEKHFTVRTVNLEIETKRYAPSDVKAVRDRLNASQALLATFLGVSTHTVSLWEQGKRNVPKIACRYLDDVQKFPELWTTRLKAAKVSPLT